ncbi:peptidase S41 [Bacteroidia bacterium]|nr:peptidase S41 [Bacteroidia bacterium]GHU83226.1 peptidase S41 [Bacteroidia bacterium]
MTKLNKTRQFLLFTLAGILLFGCKVDDIVVPDNGKEKDPANVWIDETMRRYYLWEDEIPAAEKLDYSAEAPAFFNAQLSLKDGKTREGSHHYYSSINKKTGATKTYMGDKDSFGFEFQYYHVNVQGSGTSFYALLTLYVLPNSPAEIAGIKRGEWIREINNKPISGNADELLATLASSKASFGIAKDLQSSVSKRVELTAATVIDDPVFLHKTFTNNQGKNIGYLVYNHFTAGLTDDDETFNDSMRKAFADFKADGVNEFILDLRYNGGGLVTSAQLLSTMLAPASALNDVFCFLKYNTKKQSYTDRRLYLDPKLYGTTGANLDLKRIFVITSRRTASASEAVINSLKYYLGDQMILVGELTEGKNVGSVTFKDDRYDWELHPIVSKLFNKDEKTDYSDGFKPTYPCEETSQVDYYTLGDEQEFMLKQVLNFIKYGTPINSGESKSLRSSDGHTLTPLYHSLDRKKTNGVVLDKQSL